MKKALARAASIGAAVSPYLIASVALAQEATTTPGAPSTGAGDSTLWWVLGIAAVAVIGGIFYLASRPSSTLE